MDILSNESLLNYVNYVKSMPDSEKLKFLSSSHPEWTINKILYDYYTDEDIILGDGDLLKLIESHRVGNIPREGISDMDPIEIHYLMKAWKSQQYHRFMCHILNRYTNPKNISKIHPIIINEGDNIECGICWRSLDGKSSGNLAFTSENTGTTLCSNCMYQLFMFTQLMSLLDNKEFNKLMY
jgi:hypothetical protein